MSNQTIPDKESIYSEARGDGVVTHRAHQRDRRADAGPVAGLLLLTLGLLFIAQNMGYLAWFNNWWALFLLLPAYSSFATAWSAYHRNAGVTNQTVIGPAIAGLLFLMLTVTFLFSFNLALFGPVLLIGAGVLLLLRSR